jgi:HK97 family phage major capsid protein
MDYKDKLGEAEKLFSQAKAILDNPQATAEEKASVAKMVSDAKAIKDEAFQLKDIFEAGITIAQAQAARQSDDKAKAKTNADGSPGEFKAWGEFLEAVWMAGNPKIKTAPDPRLRYFKDKKEDDTTSPMSKEKKDMAEAVGATGGFLVPVEQQTVLQSVSAEGAIVRSRATIIPMARRQVLLPVLDQTGAVAGVPHWFGGLKFYWAEEAGEKTESDAKFKQVNLTAHKLIGYTRASDELVGDSAISLAAFLQGPLGFAGGVQWMEDYSFLNGSGAGQPLGIIQAGATIAVPRQVQHSVTYIDLVNMFDQFLPSTKGLWIISQSCLSALLTMQDPDGHYIWPTLFQGGASAGLPNTLMGMPYVVSEKLPRIGTEGDVLLVDLRYYLIGDRQATTIESTQFDRWQFDQTSWRVVHRVDGQPWLSAPLTYQDGTTEVSPFVMLSTKST